MTKSIFLIAIIYLILIALFFYFQRLLMYFPSQNLPNPNQVQLSEMKVIQLQTSDGLTLYSWYHKAKHNRKTIVYFHGNGGNIADRSIRVKPLLNAGMGLLMLNYRGYGDNEGKPSEKGLIKDAQSALNFLLNKENIELEKIILLGESLGTAMAIKLASENLIGAVILESPFISATEVGRRAYPFLPVKLLIKDRYDNLSKIGRIKSPILIIHGERDMIVPAKHGRTLLKNAKQPKRGVFLSDAGHNDLFYHGTNDHILNFIAELDSENQY